MYSWSHLMWSQLMLSFSLCDLSDQVPFHSFPTNPMYQSINAFRYCYHSVNVISLAWFQSDHIKRLLASTVSTKLLKSLLSSISLLNLIVFYLSYRSSGDPPGNSEAYWAREAAGLQGFSGLFYQEELRWGPGLARKLVQSQAPWP